MPEISWATMRRVAEKRGHSNLTVSETRQGFWRFSCGCGYQSAGTALKKNAVDGAIHHFDLVVSGAWWKPKFPGGPTYQESLDAILAGRAKAAERATRRANARSNVEPADSVASASI